MELLAFKKCPICGGIARMSATDGMARFKKDLGFHYLKHAASALDCTVEQLVNIAQVYRCETCDTYYCDPWVSQEVASHVFTVGSPDHIAGWGNFEHWLSSNHPNSTQSRVQKLHEVLEKKMGAVSSYAEFGCPFQGFLLLYKGAEVDPAGRIASFARAMAGEADPRWAKVARLYRAVTRLANSLVVAYHKTRLFKESRGTQLVKTVALPRLPIRRLLLTQDTTRAWGNNCVRYGGSCRYYSAQVLGADVLPFIEMVDEVVQEKHTPVDLLGIFNSLDHTKNPLQVIQHGLKLARHIVIATHHASHAGKQHQYAFGEKFPEWLATVLGGVTVEDITHEVIGNGYRDNNYILISNVSND